MMIAHVLVPLDGSAVSERALDPAKEIAGRFGARITLLTAIFVFPGSPAEPPDTDEPGIGGGRAYLGDVRARHGLPATTAMHAVLGSAGEAIVAFARENDVDLIVMSTHGTTGTDALRHTLGSVAWRVLEDAPCSMFLVPVHRLPAAAAG